VIVSPKADTAYRITARCSSDAACASERIVQVQVYTGDGSDLGPSGRGNGLGLMVTHEGCDPAGNPPTCFVDPDALLRWTGGPQPPGVSGYDVYRLDDVGPLLGMTPAFPGQVFAGATCVTAAGQVSNPGPGLTASVTDAGAVMLGKAHFYQVGHHAAMSGHSAPLGVQPPSASFPGQIVQSAMDVCP
jgi:hypothetical protein